MCIGYSEQKSQGARSRVRTCLASLSQSHLGGKKTVRGLVKAFQIHANCLQSLGCQLIMVYARQSWHDVMQQPTRKGKSSGWCLCAASRGNWPKHLADAGLLLHVQRPRHARHRQRTCGGHDQTFFSSLLLVSLWTCRYGIQMVSQTTVYVVRVLTQHPKAPPDVHKLEVFVTPSVSLAVDAPTGCV